MKRPLRPLRDTELWRALFVSTRHEVTRRTRLSRRSLPRLNLTAVSGVPSATATARLLETKSVRTVPVRTVPRER